MLNQLDITEFQMPVLLYVMPRILLHAVAGVVVLCACCAQGTAIQGQNLSL
jgi:hypothetical protein